MKGIKINAGRVAPEPKEEKHGDETYKVNPSWNSTYEPEVGESFLAIKDGVELGNGYEVFEEYKDTLDSIKIDNPDKIESVEIGDEERGYQTWIRVWKGSHYWDLLPLGDHRQMDTDYQNLINKVKAQAHELTEQRKAAERRNKELEALHIVWCTGCEGGKPGLKDLDEETLETIYYVMNRLRTWWINKCFREMKKSSGWNKRYWKARMKEARNQTMIGRFINWCRKKIVRRNKVVRKNTKVKTAAA